MSDDENNRREMLLPFDQNPEDSGIDSDDSEEEQPDAELLPFEESESSDEEIVLRSPPPKAMRDRYHDRMREIHDEQEAIPLIAWQRSRRECGVYDFPTMDSPSASPNPIFEIELTPSEEEDDTSLLELIIPIESCRKDNDSTDAKFLLATSLLCNLMFCCLPK